MNKQQKFEKALQNVSSRHLSDEILSAAQNRTWAAVSEKLASPTKEPVFSSYFAPRFVPTLAYALAAVLVVVMGAALYQQQGFNPPMISQIPDAKPKTTPAPNVAITTQPPEATGSSSKATVATTSTYKNDDLGFSTELPGTITKQEVAGSKTGFSIKDKIALKENGTQFATVVLYATPNTKKQPVQDWVNDQKINGTKTTVTHGNFSGILVKNNQVSRSSFWDALVAHAAAPQTEDFYAAVNGQIMLMSTEFTDPAQFETPDLTVSFQTFQRAPRSAFQYGFKSLRYKNNIYIFGGVNDTQLAKDANRKVYKYNADVDEWSEKTSVPEEYLDFDSLHFASGDVVGDQAYLFTSLNKNNNSRANIMIYNFTADSWSRRTTAVAPYPSTLRDAGITMLNNKFYLVGGYIYDESRKQKVGNLDWATSETTDAMYIYDPQSDTWQTGPNLNVSRNTKAVTVFNGKMYAMLGESGDLTQPQQGFSDFLKQTTETSEYYDPQDNAWHMLNNFPKLVDTTGGRGYNFAAANGTLYFFDEFELNEHPDNNAVSGQAGVRVFEYSPKNDSWTRIYPTFQIRDVRSVVGFEHSIYIFGTGSGPQKTQLEEFVPSK